MSRKDDHEHKQKPNASTNEHDDIASTMMTAHAKVEHDIIYIDDTDDDDELLSATSKTPPANLKVDEDTHAHDSEDKSMKSKLAMETIPIYYDKLNSGSRVLDVDSKGTWKATIQSEKEEKNRKGFVIRFDDAKKSSKKWVPRDEVVGIVIEKHHRMKVTKKTGTTLIEFDSLTTGSRNIVEFCSKALQATITVIQDNKDGQKGYMVIFDAFKVCNLQWISRDTVLDIIIEDTKENKVVGEL